MASISITAITSLLGGAKVLRKQVRSSSEMMDLTRNGLPADTLDTIAEELGVSRTTVAKIIGIPDRTLSRRISSDARLTADESDRTVRLARVLADAKATLGSMDKARLWLQTPNRALSGQRPLDLLDTDIGTSSVQTVLGRIAYGVYS